MSLFHASFLHFIFLRTSGIVPAIDPSQSICLFYTCRHPLRWDCPCLRQSLHTYTSSIPSSTTLYMDASYNNCSNRSDLPPTFQNPDQLQQFCLCFEMPFSIPPDLYTYFLYKQSFEKMQCTWHNWSFSVIIGQKNTSIA